MKRAFVNLNQSPVVDDDEAKAKIKHETLLQEYLQLRKEVDSKNRKLQTIKQKRKKLLGVVRLLRQKRRCLLLNQSAKQECEEEGFVQPQDPKMPKKMLERERNQCVNEGREQNGKQLPPLRIEKSSSSTNRLINDRRLVKKKVSWLDEMPLKV